MTSQQKILFGSLKNNVGPPFFWIPPPKFFRTPFKKNWTARKEKFRPSPQNVFFDHLNNFFKTEKIDPSIPSFCRPPF